MLGFLFKRPDDKGGDKPGGRPDAAPPARVPEQGRGEGRRADAGQAERRTQQAAHLATLSGQEDAIADFILQCEFSDLRMAAAEQLHARAVLERVHGAIRNTDRRVAKLLHGRLDALCHHESELRRGDECLALAGQLLAGERLTPNQVADLDRAWSVIQAPELKERFDAVRSQLAQRLEAQVALQRAMIDRLHALRQLPAAEGGAAELKERFQQLAGAQEEALRAPEAAALPRSLTNEFASEMARIGALIDTLQDGEAAGAQRAALLDGWEATDPAQLNGDELRRQWQRLAPAPESAQAALQQRFDAMLARLPAPAKAEAPRARTQAGPDQHFLDTLDAMEAALGQGSLGTAAELDKALKDSKVARLPGALADRLAHLRAELKRLSDWARWGGNVSREEMIKSVEHLATQNLSMSELAKKVGSMRERWKTLDSLSGAAPKSLWERFDAACTATYAPAAAHFKQLAEERHANAAKAAALVAEAQAQVARVQDAGAAPDWKQVAGTVQRLRLAWSHLGAIDRKEKKRLDQEFAQALNALQGPLEEQRKGAVATREQLIADVAALDPHSRAALDAVRALQERWQHEARALPLERKTEQALWQRFRAACDALFAARKDSAHAAQAERNAHLAAKEALCARLEAQAAQVTPTTVARILRDAAAEWQGIGPVPRASEGRIDKRYHDAIDKVKRGADAARRAAEAAQVHGLRDKLRLCQELEASMAADGAAAEDWRARWSALAPLAPEYESVLQQRFDAALAALEGGEGERARYAELLEQNRARLLHEILRLEIALGIDSGAEFARERLKLQVESLQSSLKSGQKPASQAAQFRSLCAMPARVDDRTATRIEQLFMRLSKGAA
jgi:hypothetical protein